MLRISLIAVSLVLLAPFVGADDAPVLTKFGVESPELMMTKHLKRLAKQAFEDRLASYEALETPQEIRAYQNRMREFFIEKLGGFPDRTPLNARIVGETERETFRIEKIIYESRPNFFVTAVLYLPLGEGPHPAVLVPCGHSANGKASEAYQRACMLLASNGIAALCYDPIGQGERYQILRSDGEPRFGSTLEHTMVGVPAILLGSSTANYRIWDGIRGIDDLVSRPDIDPNRIGCTGNSGGGTLTSYIMALDPRVTCAAPSCYITSFDRLIDTIGAQDAEQNVHGQIAFGLDHADYIAMRAPRPTLICAATQDFFDIGGTWDSFREAKRVYGRLGRPEAVDLVETDAEHGFSSPLRVAMVHWMRRWLMDLDEPIAEPEFDVFSEDELQCTPEGQVLLMPGARSVHELNMAFEMKLGQRRHRAWQAASREESFAHVREVIGLPARDEIAMANHKRVDMRAEDAYRVEEYVVSPEPDVHLPVLLYVPDQPSGDTHILVDEAGMHLSTVEQEAMARGGAAVIAVDVRGVGETARPESGKGGFDPYFGADWADYFLAYMLGKSYVGMRTEDILVVRKFMEHHIPVEARQRIHLFALGETAIPALHAAALEPDLFTSVQLKELTITWKEVIGTKVTRNQLINAVHGALQVYDLPDLITSLPPSKLQIISRARPAS